LIDLQAMCGELLNNALCLLLSPRTCPVGLEMLVLIEFGWRNDLRLSLMFLKSTWPKNPTFALNISLVVPFEPNPFYWQPHYKPYPF